LFLPGNRLLARILLAVLVAAGVSACERSGGDAGAAGEAAVSATDDLGRTVTLDRPATRVVALVPSVTETVVALGAGERLMARTDYDTSPAVSHLPSVGGGLDPSIEALVSLRPDLVVAWAQDRTPELRERLDRFGIPVFAVSTQDTADVFANIERMGALLGQDAAADALSERIRDELAEVRHSVAGRERPAVFYAVGTDPPMTPGPETFVIQLLELAGGRTIFPELGQNWPVVSLEAVVRRQPDVIILPVGEHSDRRARHLAGRPGWREMEAVRAGRVVEVPVDLMNRPGPHIAEAARVLRDVLHGAGRGDGG